MRNEVYKIFLITGFAKIFKITQAGAAASKIAVPKEVVNAAEPYHYVRVSFKKILRDKASFSAEKIFVVRAGEAYTWRDIDCSSNIIAADLQRQSVQKGSHVAICGANSMVNSTIYLPEKIRSRVILELIDRERCTIFHSVPTMLLALIHNENFSTDKVAALRCSIISGARVTETQMKTFRRLMPNNHFLSSYGLSEMAPVSITAYDDNEEKILHTVGKLIENIFPAEIEAAISEHDNIDDVKVFGAPHDFFGEEVCACVKLKSAVFDEKKMRAALSAQLAKYKIPSHFLVYDKFPLLGSGKIDSVALKRDAVEKIKFSRENLSAD